MNLIYSKESKARKEGTQEPPPKVLGQEPSAKMPKPNKPMKSKKTREARANLDDNFLSMLMGGGSEQNGSRKKQSRKRKRDD